MKFKMRGKVKPKKFKAPPNDGAELRARARKQQVEAYTARMYEKYVKDSDAETK